MSGSEEISFGLIVFGALFSAGSDSPWWMRSLAAAYLVASAFIVGRHVGSSKIDRRDDGA